METQMKKPNIFKRWIVSAMIGLGNGMGMLGKDPKKQDGNTIPASDDIGPDQDHGEKERHVDVR
ncbi:MAG: hypothetical protein WCT27_05130 [Patescibacteria group bacterium]|jgi:hypothetical protein